MKILENYYDIEESYEKNLGVKPVKVHIEKIEDVFSGHLLEVLLDFKNRECAPKECHYNTGMSLTNNAVAKKYGYTLSFCEGLIYGWVQHCWTCVRNDKTGEVHYVDFTLNEEGEATLFCEWKQNEIFRLFDKAGYAFIPFRDYWEYKKSVRDIIRKKYPNIA